MSKSNPYLHPARYTPAILDMVAEILHAAQMHEAIAEAVEKYGDDFDPEEVDVRTWAILDPMAGVGGIHELRDKGDAFDTLGIEIEPEWADAHHLNLQGDATDLHWLKDETFDAVVVSPVYGNRMSDSHKAQDTSRRVSYTHNLRKLTGDEDRTLLDNNAGKFYAWQDAYWELHRKAWEEMYRLLKPGGYFILNTSDFIRDFQVIPVTDRHVAVLTAIGFIEVRRFAITTPRMRYGSNSDARVDHEDIVVLRKPGGKA